MAECIKNGLFTVPHHKAHYFHWLSRTIRRFYAHIRLFLTQEQG
jgi:hypothetical protein